MVFGRFRVRKGTQWTPQRLIWTGLLMAWAVGQTLGARWEQACEAEATLHRHWKLGWHHEDRDGLVYLWPDNFRKSPLLVLRPIKATYLLPFRVLPRGTRFLKSGTCPSRAHDRASCSKLEQPGKPPIYLLTNILNAEKLSDDDARAPDEMRRGIEVCYRSYKQTLGRQTMKSRTPETCLLEAQLTMLGLWLLGLMSI